MKITIKDATNADNLAYELRQAFYPSRFKLDIAHTKWNVIELFNVRLRDLKPYCGSHPGACHIPSVHRRHRFLEGADWVEFNDTLNNVLDRLHVNARVASSVVLVRRGRERCIEYRPQRGHGRNLEWAKIGAYDDYCGKDAPASEFPAGTPGIYEAIGYNEEG